MVRRLPIGNADVYNPWSVISYLDASCEAGVYWGNTSGNAVISEPVANADADTLADVCSLLEPGGEVWAPLDLDVVFPDIGIRTGAVWSMLYLAGCLTTEDVEDPSDVDRPRPLRVPDKEISPSARRSTSKMQTGWQRPSPPSPRGLSSKLRKASTTLSCRPPRKAVCAGASHFRASASLSPAIIRFKRRNREPRPWSNAPGSEFMLNAHAPIARFARTESEGRSPVATADRAPLSRKFPRLLRRRCPAFPEASRRVPRSRTPAACSSRASRHRGWAVRRYRN